MNETYKYWTIKICDVTANEQLLNKLKYVCAARFEMFFCLFLKPLGNVKGMLINLQFPRTASMKEMP